MVVTQSMAIRNPCYKTNKTIQVKGIMIEGVGCPQASAKVFAHNRNREDCEGRCSHAFIDANDGSVIQILPWEHRGWHCGKHPRTKKNANNTHIGIQLCEPAQIRYKKRNEIVLAGDKEKALAAVQKTYKSAVQLCAKLCKEFGLDPVKDVVSRKEGYEAGLCSMQASPEFVWDAVGATYEMDTFRADVQMEMTGISDTFTEVEPEVVEKIAEKLNAVIDIDLKGEPGPKGNADPIEGFKEGFNHPDEEITAAVDQLVKEVKITDAPILEIKEEPKVQMVKITVDNLRIRSTPGVGNNTTGKFTGRGTFAITEIQNGTGAKLGWGKLQNGAGWICLDYVEML